MKKLFLIMLLASIMGNLFAQKKSASDKAFEVPEEIIITRKFDVKLDKGNRMTLRLSALADLNRVTNIDSLLKVFFTDINGLKDSIADPLTSKRIDHVTDAAGRKKLRFQQFREKGASFLINEANLALLKTGQDTAHIIGIINNPVDAKENISKTNPRYYHFTFYVNDINDLATYTNGELNAKLKMIEDNVTGKWPLIKGGGDHYMKADNSISAEKPRGVTGYTAGGGSFLTFLFGVTAANYKNYFVPGFSLGTKLTLSNPKRTFKWEPALYWEPHFFFSKDSANKLRTFRNDFLTLTYAQGGTKERDPKKDFSYSAVFSLGYLVRKDGNYFEKNSFRLGAGKIQMLKTSVEPSLWFNNFFRAVTPGIRITQYF